MENLVNVTEQGNVVLTREDSSKMYGSWFSEGATPDVIVSWCTKRIALYEMWIKNCKELKAKNQLALVKDMPKDILEAALIALTEQSDKATA